MEHATRNALGTRTHFAVKGRSSKKPLIPGGEADI